MLPHYLDVMRREVAVYPLKWHARLKDGIRGRFEGSYTGLDATVAS